MDSHVEGDRGCVKCGYNIRGLNYAAKCPECGTPVADSVRGVLLQFADRDYLRTILTGHSWVLNAILVYVVLTVTAFVGTIAPLLLAASPYFELIMTGLFLSVSIWSFLGYYKLTQPDPQFTGTERPDSARQVVRIAAMASIAINALTLLIDGAIAITGTTHALISMLSSVLGLLSLGAFGVQFFAMMNYTIWLSRRVPDAWMMKRARTYRWLLPVLATVGVLAIGLGPLIALVLYWNLLDRMRKHLKSLVATGRPAGLSGMVV
jgi:hypothetical protein